MRSEAIARSFQLQARLLRILKTPFHVSAGHQIPAEAKPRAFTNVARTQGFSTFKPVYAVHVTNPRQDDDGKEKLIDITSRAAKVSTFRMSYSNR